MKRPNADNMFRMVIMSGMRMENVDLPPAAAHNDWN